MAEPVTMPVHPPIPAGLPAPRQIMRYRPRWVAARLEQHNDAPPLGLRFRTTAHGEVHVRVDQRPRDKHAMAYKIAPFAVAVPPIFLLIGLFPLVLGKGGMWTAVFLLSIAPAFVSIAFLIYRHAQTSSTVVIDPSGDRVRLKLAGRTIDRSSIAAIQILDSRVFSLWQCTLVIRTESGFARILVMLGVESLEPAGVMDILHLGEILGVPVQHFRIRGFKTPRSAVVISGTRHPDEAVEPFANGVGRVKSYDSWAEPIPLPSRADLATCLACGYSLAGLDAPPKCPECGMLLRPDDARTPDDDAK